MGKHSENKGQGGSLSEEQLTEHIGEYKVVEPPVPSSGVTYAANAAGEAFDDQIRQSEKNSKDKS